MLNAKLLLGGIIKGVIKRYTHHQEKLMSRTYIRLHTHVGLQESTWFCYRPKHGRFASMHNGFNVGTSMTRTPWQFSQIRSMSDDSSMAT